MKDPHDDKTIDGLVEVQILSSELFPNITNPLCELDELVRKYYPELNKQQSYDIAAKMFNTWFDELEKMEVI